MRNDSERLSVFVDGLIKRDQVSGAPHTLGTLVAALQEKGHMVICMIFAAPFLLPIPLPGLSTAFGAVILLASVQMMLGKSIWIPPGWKERPIPHGLVDKMLVTLAKTLKRIESIFKPRISTLVNTRYSDQINGFVLMVLAILLALPMPPGFNAPPAAAIILLALGELEEDGLAVLLAWLMTLLNIAFFTAFFVLGFQGVKTLMNV